MYRLNSRPDEEDKIAQHSSLARIQRVGLAQKLNWDHDRTLGQLISGAGVGITFPDRRKFYQIIKEIRFLALTMERFMLFYKIRV